MRIVRFSTIGLKLSWVVGPVNKTVGQDKVESMFSKTVQIQFQDHIKNFSQN